MSDPVPSNQQIAGEIKALSDPARLELIELIATIKEPSTVAELAEIVSISPALASYHLLIAKKAGILKSHRRGRFQLTFEGEWWLAALDERRTVLTDLLASLGLSPESPTTPG